MKAQYLLRFDDLCPTMDGEKWQRFVPLMRRFGIQPILAVVPENCDPELEICPPDPAFWDEMRAMQSAGATIGLHGYRHLCTSTGRSLIPMHRRSEFAGVVPEEQRAWIRAGLEILRERGLEPAIWVAPRHGFDAVTLAILREEGICVLSDGFAIKPFEQRGVIWIPQQLWAPVEKPDGLWTICVHANSATDAFVVELEAFLVRCAGQFTSVDRVVQEWPMRRRSLGDRLFHWKMTGRLQLRRRLRAET